MAIDDETAALIKKYAIKNAVDYGKAETGSVLGKIISLSIGIKVPELRKAVDEEVSRINRMDRQELEDEYKPFAAEFEQKAREKALEASKHSMVIEGALGGAVITRFPPEPGGYIHIGNAKQCILSNEIATKYRGKIYLYFDDTNPEKCRQEYVDGIKEDMEWLGIKFDKEYYASDNIEKVYQSAAKLIASGNAYVCLCSAEEIKKKRHERVACAHAAQSPEQNASMFSEMLAHKYDEGEAVVRLKGEMAADNATFRDPTLLRIKNTKHYRQGNKYIVWPTYHINTPVMDHLYGITDVIRGKEYEIWDEVNKRMLNLLGITPPRFHYEARLSIIGNTTAKRVIRKLISEGLISGWDDPRLLTIIALRRRGIQPEAIKEFVMRFGMSRTDSSVPMDMLLAENKKIIDKFSKHLYFVDNPVEMIIKDLGIDRAILPLHPQKELGVREYSIGDSLFISGADAASLKEGEMVRLKGLADIKITKTGSGISAEKAVISARAADGQHYKIIQWVSAAARVECSVEMPMRMLDDLGNFNHKSLVTISGYAEGYADRLEHGEIVQFERFGYCILDNNTEKKFIFISK